MTSADQSYLLLKQAHGLARQWDDGKKQQVICELARLMDELPKIAPVITVTIYHLLSDEHADDFLQTIQEQAVNCQ